MANAITVLTGRSDSDKVWGQGREELLLEVLSASEVGQEKGEGTPADFLIAGASGVSTARSRTRDLSLSWEPETFGKDSPQVNVISNPLCRGSEIRIIWKD